jgi:Cu/Ag efflux protein CusF
MTRVSLVLLAVLLVAACSHQPPLESGKRYAMQGVVKAIDTSDKTAAIDAGQIGDWMAPMTMPYSVKPDSELKKLHVGDRIEATVVVVSDTSYYVTDVKVVKP